MHYGLNFEEWMIYSKLLFFLLLEKKIDLQFDAQSAARTVSAMFVVEHN